MSVDQTELIITDYTDARGRNYLLTGLLVNNRLIEAHFERRGAPSILGNIYIGRVDSVSRNLNAAFVEFQPGQNGYLPLERCHSPVYIKKNNSPHIVQGDELLVQVEKENVKTKLPTLSTNLNFSGSYLVLTTENKKAGVSKKIDRTKRKELLSIFSEESFQEYGLIIRTNAQNASAQELQHEYESLKNDLKKLIQDAAYRTTWSCLKRALPAHLKILQDIRSHTLSRIVTDLPEIYGEVAAVQKNIPVIADVPLSLWNDKMISLSALYNLQKQTERALAKQVWMSSGAYLIIEPTEALTVIDVNTGKNIQKKDPEEQFYAVNREAAREIAHQLRLRNISGIILIDFIDMKAKASGNEILQYLKACVSEDPVPVQVVDYTKLGLVELTRKKVSKSLREQLT